MGYLVCDNCEGFYELEADESPEDFVLKCNCGGNLEHVKNRDNETPIENNEINESNRVSKINGMGYAEKKSSRYNKVVFFGVALGATCLIGFAWGYTFFIILSFIGFIIALYGYGRGISWNKGITGENIVADYLDLLPDDYIIFNDVKFPGSYGNLDHVVVGLNGVFVIETKNIDGFFMVDDRKWSYKKNIHLKGRFTNAKTQPGKQVLFNVKNLGKFLDSNGVDVDDLQINPIVTLVKNNFSVKTQPEQYNILEPSSIPEFILKNKQNVDNIVANEIVSLLEPHSIEISYREENFE